MFEGWDDFYLLVGSAAAALIGLLFVVVTLTTRLERNAAERGARYYMTPIVFHLAAVFVLSALAMAPGASDAAIALVTGAAALWGLGLSAWVAQGIRKPTDPPPHWSDVWCYGVAPGLVYALLLALAAQVLRGETRVATWQGAALTALLLISIRNAWDLVTYLAPRAETSTNGGMGEADTR